MAVEHGLFDYSFTAEADLSAKRYLFVKAGTADQAIVIVASQGEDAIGVLQNKPADTKQGTVRMLGVSKVVCGDTITYGNKITVGADARAEVAASGDEVMGRALEDGVDGETITCWIQREGILA